MIILEFIRWQNFLSTGNIFTEIVLNDAKTTLISGNNGSGKSTVMDAICFVLFNKPFRKINKPQLVNTITGKDLLVEIEFSVGDASYLIRRGYKPNIFEIFKDGVLLNQDAANRDYQQYLEENILRTNYKTFCQVEILGNANFVPFMSLPAAQRRMVIEDLLDIQIFSVMNSVLKAHVSGNKDDLESVDNDIKLTEKTIELKKQHKKEMEENLAEIIAKKKETILEQKLIIKLNQEKIDKLTDKIKEFNGRIKDRENIEDSMAKTNDAMKRTHKLIKSLKDDIQFYEKNPICPQCDQNIDEDFKIGAIGQKTKLVEKNSELFLELKIFWEDLTEKNEDINKVLNNIEKANSRIQTYLANIKVANTLINSIQDDIDNAHKPKSTEFEEEETKLKTLHEDKMELLHERELYSVASVMLKDTGIKTEIIRQYLPVMNNLINKYLEEMEFYCQFHIDESFSETIKSRHRDDFSYTSFSEGEKMRINLAILFTWREIARMRNASPFNLLILDEIMDSSLDASGTDEFLFILNNLTKDNNVIIISHKHDQIADKFDKTIKFDKVKNFSRIIK
jgi:DNA repair exonuclease SbcCD ATPase subunit